MIFAGNWKMNKGPKETREFLLEFLERIEANAQKDYLLFAPATNLYLCADMLKSTSVGWGAQNCYFEASGAFTGEISPQVLQEMGATHCLVGHSERRQIFNESDEILAKKASALQNFGIIPVYCVGETLEEREAGKTLEVVMGQLHAASLDGDFLIAYEPVWAIGTGKVASPEQAQEVHAEIRKEYSQKLLYGGSVKPENAAELAAQNDIDGFLIGGASLKVESFIAISQNSK